MVRKFIMLCLLIGLNAVCAPTMPRRICDVEIPIGLESNVVFDVVSVSGNQWYANAISPNS